MKKLLTIIGILALIYFLATITFQRLNPVLKWNWEKINTNNLHFPKHFFWGVATAAYQVEGGFKNCNWSWWEKQKLPNGKPTIANNDTCGLADNDWNLFALDIKLMKRLGVNAYRFSVAWSKIMPDSNKIDTNALKHYQILCDSLVSNGIQPMVTLFHYTYPLWMMKIGGFQKEQNIKYFVKFSKIVYQALHKYVKYWFTINEPVVYAYSSYFSGEYPPGKTDPKLTAIVLDNLIKAHVQVYKTLKKLGGDSIHIGIVKNITFMDPYNKWNLLDQIIAYLANYNFNLAFINTFKNGKFHFFMPSMVNFKDYIPQAPKSLDFIGLNYYSHYAFRFSLDLNKALSPLPYPNEQMTDMDYTIYPEGIYRAIKLLSSLNKPIIITENGIADSLDNRRARFIKQSLYAVSKAITDGFNVKGYFYWSLLDNFEWNLGYSRRFGLYKVDFKTQKRTLRKGAYAYINIIKNWEKYQK